MVDKSYPGDLNILAHLYNNLYADIRDHKARQWRTVALTLALIGATATLSQSVLRCVDKRALIAIVLLVGLVGISLIHDLTYHLMRLRSRRRIIDNIFKFFDDGEYAENALLNPAWENKKVSYFQDAVYLWTWWSSIALAVALTIYIITSNQLPVVETC